MFGAIGVPSWIYEYGFALATLFGVAFAATLEKILEPLRRPSQKQAGVSPRPGSAGGQVLALETSGRRYSARLAFGAAVGAILLFCAGYYVREAFVRDNLMLFLHVVAVFIGVVGGNFVYSAWQKNHWKAIYSRPVLLILAATTFETWSQREVEQRRPGPPAPFSAETKAGITVEPQRPTASIAAFASPTLTTARLDAQPTSVPSSVAEQMESPAPGPSIIPSVSDGVQRVIDGMTSSNPKTRLDTLTQAVRSDDPYLRHLALSKAFAGSDDILRSVALRDAVQTSASFVVSIEGALPTKDPISQAIGTSVEIGVQDFKSGSGRFKAVASVSNNAGSGVVSNRGLTFTIPLDKVLGGYDFCNGSETMLPGRSVLKGRMHCQNDQGLLGKYTGNYDIMTDLLK